jgi:hypothetical protein
MTCKTWLSPLCLITHPGPAIALSHTAAQQIFPEWEKDNYFKKIEEKFHLLDTVEKVEKLVKLVENYGFNMYSADGITEVLEDAFGDK